MSNNVKIDQLHLERHGDGCGYFGVPEAADAEVMQALLTHAEGWLREAAEKASLGDLVGDPLEIAVGISYFPHPDIKAREELFSRAREAFHSGQRDGGVVVRAD